MRNFQIVDKRRPSKGVFLRRRLAVIATVLLLVGFGLIFFANRSGAGPAERNTVALPDEVVDTAEDRNKEANADAPECGSGDLQVSPVVDKTSYGPDEKPQLSLSVENTGEKSCYADLGTAQMIFEVQSGGHTVWMSSDCQKSPDHRLVILEPGKPLTTKPVEWDRTVSSKETCDVEKREAVTAGGAAYHLLVAVAGVPGDESAQFLLN